jgi:hypothetical protein
MRQRNRSFALAKPARVTLPSRQMRTVESAVRAALLLAATSCSFGLTSSPEPRKPCPTSDLAPVLDTAAAVGLAAASIYIAVRGGDEYAETDDASYATVAGVSAGLYTIAATRGFSNVRACRDHRIELAFEERHAQARTPNPNAHDQAWALTKQAASSARNGDCAVVTGVDRALREIDPEFHATVFVRDVAIARCLAQPMVVPAAAPTSE